MCQTVSTVHIHTHQRMLSKSSEEAVTGAQVIQCTQHVQ